MISTELERNLVAKRAKLKKEEEEKEGNMINPDTMFERGMYVITGFFSSFVFNIISPLGTGLQITLLVVELSIIWITLYKFVYHWVQHMQILKKNRNWQKVILQLMDFFSMLDLFLLFQFFLFMLETAWLGGMPNLLESIVAMIFIVATTLTIMQLVKAHEILVPYETTESTTKKPSESSLSSLEKQTTLFLRNFGNKQLLLRSQK